MDVQELLNNFSGSFIKKDVAGKIVEEIVMSNFPTNVFSIKSTDIKDSADSWIVKVENGIVRNGPDQWVMPSLVFEVRKSNGAIRKIPR